MDNKNNSKSSTIHKNKRAYHDYTVIERMEAGIVLTGTEIKVLRQGRSNISDAHVIIDQRGEAWVMNMIIPHYEFGNIANHLEARRRKLLLHKKEIKALYHRIKTEGLALVALSLYLKKGKAKLEIALAKGKKNYDKRQDQIKKDEKKELKKEFGM